MALGTIADVGLQAHLVKFPVAAVQKKEIGDRVVGNEEIHQPVIINVAGDNTPSLAE
jgi:hypothetical protein